MGKQKKTAILNDMLYQPLQHKPGDVIPVSAPVYWQTAIKNRREVQLYRDWILNLMMQRYEWINLPETCDARYLEFTLALQGVATICYVEPLGWISTQAATSGQPNIYDNPISWDSIGNNGHHARVTPNNGVLVYSNTLRFPEWNFVDIYATRLAHYDVALETNLVQQQIPWIITCPYERQQDAIQVIKQAAGGEPAIIGLKSMDQLGFELLTTPVDFKADKIQDAKARTWNEVYTFLGIDNLDRKGERMIEDEVNANNDPVDKRFLDGLSARKQAADKLNERFGLEVDVVEKQPNSSDNYNMLHNLDDLMQLADGGGINDGI